MSYFNLSSTRRLALATVSALAVIPAGRLAEFLAEYLPLPGQPGGGWARQEPSSYWEYLLIGSIFGVLVMVPFITAVKGKMYRAAGLIISSILIYAFAVELVYKEWAPYYSPFLLVELVVSGMAGALLVTLAVVVIAPVRATRWLWVYAAGAGLIGGTVFHLVFLTETWEGWPVFFSPLFVGYLSWQLLVFWALLCAHTSPTKGL